MHYSWVHSNYDRKEASLSGTGKTHSYTEIYCMLPVLLSLHQTRCPHCNNCQSYLSDSHPVLHGQSTAFHLPLSLGSRQLQRSHLLFHLFFEDRTWILDTNCSKIRLFFFWVNTRLFFTHCICRKMIKVPLFPSCCKMNKCLCSSALLVSLDGAVMLLAGMPTAALVIAVGLGGLSQGWGTQNPSTLVPCCLAMLPYQSCEAPLAPARFEWVCHGEL